MTRQDAQITWFPLKNEIKQKGDALPKVAYFLGSGMFPLSQAKVEVISKDVKLQLWDKTSSRHPQIARTNIYFNVPGYLFFFLKEDNHETKTKRCCARLKSQSGGCVLLLCLPALHDCLAILGLRMMALPADLSASMSVFCRRRESLKFSPRISQEKCCWPDCWWTCGAFQCGQKCRYLRRWRTWGSSTGTRCGVCVQWDIWKNPFSCSLCFSFRTTL